VAEKIKKLIKINILFYTVNYIRNNSIREKTRGLKNDRKNS